MVDFNTTRKRETGIGMGADTSADAFHFSEKSGLLLPFVASIFRSGMSSRISSLMSASLGFFGRSMLNPLLNVFRSSTLMLSDGLLFTRRSFQRDPMLCAVPEVYDARNKQ